MNSCKTPGLYYFPDTTTRRQTTEFAITKNLSQYHPRISEGAAMPVQRLNLVIPREDGGVEVHPLKEWLRQHPDTLAGFDPKASTSHQLRNALRHLGWAMQETRTEIRLIKPGADPGAT